MGSGGLSDSTQTFSNFVGTDHDAFAMNLLCAVRDLFIVAWPILPPDAFKGDKDQIDDFTFKLAESKIQELNAVSTTVNSSKSIIATD